MPHTDDGRNRMMMTSSDRTNVSRAYKPWIARIAGLAALAAAFAASPANQIPSASAAACPDVEVIFARGTFEPVGTGDTGAAFTSALRSRLAGKSMEVYPVDYPASLDFATAADGVVDASRRVQDIAARCPNTKMVLSGFSQGAAVIAYITTDAIPPGFDPPPGITGPMPPEIADHVAAVALFGKPSNGFLNRIQPDAPPITIGHLYAAKTIDMCLPGDPICSTDGTDNGAHGAYAINGATTQAAEFAAQRISSNS